MVFFQKFERQLGGKRLCLLINVWTYLNFMKWSFWDENYK